MAGGGVKGFYRQRKRPAAGGVAKSTKASKKASKKKPQNCSQSQDCRRLPGDEEEELLRLFDMDMTYGPCIGITRLRRWERAAALGLCPPAHLRDLLLPSPLPANDPPLSSSSSSSSPAKIISTAAGASSASIAVQGECLWAGKVS
ncbi:uncharacterized protein LOC102719320 [Oryza brachyantha]|uniref:uncharacterized protein LOC102719320 n=1 Tax=Oryza brachyantha TaxID=4533 RepID=UPI0007766356|nr:uncharacterized protein LOC102719320 [Oryza brachyantha]